MTAEILTVCESAENGITLTIRGAFYRLSVPRIPCVLPKLVIALRVRATADEDGSHALKLYLSDLDGKSLGPPAEETFETRTIGNETYTQIAAVIEIHDIRIGIATDHLLNLQIDGESIANTTLYVIDGSEK
jgi:hypothetical protein